MPINEPGASPKLKSKPKVKKAVEKDTKTLSGSDSKVKSSDVSSCGPPTPSSQKAASTEWYTSEIQSMMYGFGDCSMPLLESAQLVEEIVHQQMNSLLIQSAEVATSRGSKIIGFEDLLFLMRKDKGKLKRILKYLEIKDTRSSFLKGVTTEDEEATDSPGMGDVKAAVPLRPKRVKLCMDFLSSIDDTGELTSILDGDVVDEVKLSRDLRRDRRTLFMEGAQYLEYAEARQSSFSRKYQGPKFRDWLLKDNVAHIKPNNFAMELFNYLAFETVNQIVDLALLVKQDAEPDPFKRIQPFSLCNMESFNFQLSSNTSKASVPESPAQSGSPPSSPASHASSSAAAASNIQQSTSPLKPKPKKLKKANTKSSPELCMNKCITPDEIREAIRRYWRESGPFHLFSKVHKSNMNTRLLCC